MSVEKVKDSKRERARKPRARAKKTEDPKPRSHSTALRRSGLFQARDGTFLYYEVRGEGRPLILCYGLTCRREHWRHQIPHFARDYQVITFDYRGHHFSSTPRNENNLTLEWCARDVQDVMTYLGLEEAVLLGHSMGVPVVSRAALLEPERIKGTVLICGSMNNPFHHMFYTDRLMHVYRGFAALMELAPDAMAFLWQRFTEKNPVSYFLTSRFGFNPATAQEGDVLSYMEGVNRTPIATFSALLKDYTKADGRADLKKVTCPSLVVAGESDYITPLPVQEEMARLLPKGEIVTVPHGSHNAHMDYPDRVNREIEEFLRKIDYK